jgi:hypothetical protein
LTKIHGSEVERVQDTDPRTTEIPPETSSLQSQNSTHMNLAVPSAQISRQRWATGWRRPTPNAREVTLRPGAA